MWDTITQQRQEARELNLKKFYTRTPCVRGHDAPRYVSNGACVECAKEAMRQYVKKHGGPGIKINRVAVRRGRDQALAFLGLPASMTRAEAKAAGVKTYYTGKLCRGCGELAPKYTSIGSCVLCRSRTSKRHRDKNNS